jgi:hypothetical protein
LRIGAFRSRPPVKFSIDGRLPSGLRDGHQQQFLASHGLQGMKV